jgi:hypothetical protein
MNVTIAQHIDGRHWYIQNALGKGWDGSGWAAHVEGIGFVIQVSNFDTKEEAIEFAKGKGWTISGIKKARS